MVRSDDDGGGAASPSGCEDRCGQRLGRFELLRPLGSGGMGEVWLARQDGLDRHVAVKILPSTHHRQSIDRLRREAKALARIRHPNVVPVHEIGEAVGVHYYVMDLVEGCSLEDVVATRRLACTRAVEIARQIAEALAAAHAHGVIHRDVKPANVLLVDGRDHVMLVDFGIALSELAPTLTITGDLLGTPHYMAPEQARGEASLADARTDVWGVGVTLYEMVTGARPFGGDHLVAVQAAVLERDPTAPRQLRADCPRDLETIVLRCLEKDPARRYPSARALADDLTRLLADEPIRARRASLGYRLGKHVSRHRGAWSVGAAAAVLGMLGVVALVVTARAEQRNREAAEASELVRVARVVAERGDLGEAWAKLREVELRFPRTSAVIGAYWAMVALAQRTQGEDDVLVQEVWLERLLQAGPPAADAARAHWRLGRIYDKYGFLDDARDHYALAVNSRALAADALDDARFGLQWTEWLGRRADAEIKGHVLGAGDLDGDGRDEVLVHEPSGGLTALGLRGDRLEVVRRWEMAELDILPNVELERSKLSVFDINGDGRPDLVAVVHDRCFVDELTGTTRKRALDLERCTGIKVGDLDGDGQPDLVLIRGENRMLRWARVARDWSTQEILLDDLTVDETYVTGLDIADLDGDGGAELIYAGGAWTRYDVRIARLDHGALRLLARAQVGAISGLAATDIDGDGRLEIFAVKSHLTPSPRLFDDDPSLGPSGPKLLRLEGGRLRQTWLDPLVAANAPPTNVFMAAQGRTRIGPLFVVYADDGMFRLYFGGRGPVPIRRDLRRLGVINPGEGGIVVANLDGSRNGALVFGGARVAAYGIGPVRNTPHRERQHGGADWLSTARQLRDANETELALDAYRAAAVQGADPVAVAFEEGLCHARARHWELALARFREARAGGRHDVELWRSLLEAAEAVADWDAALDAARALGDTERAAAIEKLRTSRTVFVQNFVEPWTAWRVEQPLACRGPTADGAVGLTLVSDDRSLTLPIDWDGSSFEASAVVALREMQYSKGLQIGLARGNDPWTGGGGIRSIGGGGELSVQVHSGPGVSLGQQFSSTPVRVDWSVFPERVRLSLTYVAPVSQWRVAVHDLGGKRLYYTSSPTVTRPAPGRYLMRLTNIEQPYFAASVVDLYRFEIRAAPGALRVVPGNPSEPPQRCARDLAPAGASSPLHRAFALASSGKLDAAARELAAWKASAIGRAYSPGFELDGYRMTEWEAGLARLVLLDEPLATAIVEAGKLVPLRDWGVLLRRVAYQQYVDSGQTHWVEAVAVLRHATELAPDDAHGWYMLGYCRYRLGDLAGARSAFERTVALDPELERRYPKQGGPAILLARLAARTRDATAVVRWLEQAVRHGGNLDIARHDRALGELLGDRLRQIVGD